MVVLLFVVNSVLLVPRDISKFIKMIDEGKYDEAMDLYKLSLESRGENPEIIYGLAKIYLAKEDWYLAIYELQRFLSKGKFPNGIKEVDVRLDRINANKAVKQFEEVADDCYEILKLEPDHFQANFEIAKRLYGLKNYRAAKPFFERIANSDNLEVLQGLLDVEVREKKYNQAKSLIDKIKTLTDNNLPIEVKFKEMLVNYYVKNYQAIVSIFENFDSEIRIPKPILVVVGIAYLQIKNKKEARRYFKESLEQYLEDKEEYIAEGRYLYTNLLLENNEINTAINQHQLLLQMKPEIRDNDERGIVLHKVSQSPYTCELLEKRSIDEVAVEVSNFRFPGFAYIENSITYDGSEDGNKSWIIFTVNSGMEKIFYLFFSLNFAHLNEDEVRNFFTHVREKINPAMLELPFIFLSLSGLGLNAEKRLIESFENTIFYSLEEFIELVESRKLPIFPD